MKRGFLKTSKINTRQEKTVLQSQKLVPAKSNKLPNYKINELPQKFCAISI